MIAAYLGEAHTSPGYADASDNDADGTFQGGDDPYSPVTWAFDSATLNRWYTNLPGDEGNGFPEVGIGDVPRIEIPDPGNWSSGVSVACWVYTDETKISTIITTRNSLTTGTGIECRVDGSLNPCLHIGAATSNENQTSTQAISASTWTHLAFIYDPAVGGAIYINGTEASGYSSTIGAGSSADMATSLDLGSGAIGMVGLRKDAAARDDWNGRIADLILKDGVLTEDEIDWLAAPTNLFFLRPTPPYRPSTAGAAERYRPAAAPTALYRPRHFK